MYRIKVLYIIDTVGTEKFKGGGAERSLIEIAIQNKEVLPFFISIYKGTYLAHLLEENNIQHINLGITGKYEFEKAVKLILPILKEFKPDIIHSTLARADFIARKLKRKTNIPLVNSLVSNSYSAERFKNLSLDAAIKLKIVQWRNKLSAHMADGFISNSKSIKDSFIKTLGLPEHKITVIHRGRDFQKMQRSTEQDKEKLCDELGISATDIVLLNVGRLIESKGQKDLILAFKKISNEYPKVILLIAGEGPYREVLQSTINENKLNDKVKLLGVRKDIPELHAISTAFVFPTYLEGLPGSLVEAMMAGKIIICSDIAENLECVSEREALIFPTGDINILANRMSEVLKDPFKFSQLQKNAMEQGRLKFEISQICKKYTDTYKKIINFDTNSISK